MDPRLQTLSNTLGLPGADEVPKPLETERKVLPGFPTPEYAVDLLNAYCEYVSPIMNIIPPVSLPATLLMQPTVRIMLETVARDGPQALTLAEQAFLFTIFALGALIKNDAKAETFYQQATAVSFEVASETSLESATFTFLLGLYQQTTGRLSAAWATLGIVVRIAQALGCSYPANASD
jgi:Fungal specific transcription factor domain